MDYSDKLNETLYRFDDASSTLHTQFALAVPDTDVMGVCQPHDLDPFKEISRLLGEKPNLKVYKSFNRRDFYLLQAGKIS